MRNRKKYKADLDRIQLLGTIGHFVIPKPPREPWLKVTAAATMYVWNLYDDTGASALMKWPEDWLVTRGYIKNDDTKVVRWVTRPDQFIDRKNPRLVITLEAE